MKLLILSLFLATGISAQSLELQPVQVAKAMTISNRTVGSSGCSFVWIETATLTRGQLPVTETRYTLPLKSLTDAVPEVSKTWEGVWQVTLTGDIESQRITKFGTPSEVRILSKVPIVFRDEKSSKTFTQAIDTAHRACVN